MIKIHYSKITTLDQNICDDKECQLRVWHLKGANKQVLLYFSVEGDVKAYQIVASLVDQILVRFASDPASQDITRKF
jgi:hypothetical protein